MREFASGQPPKLERPGVKDKLLRALAKGSSYKLACGYAGITYKTFREWIKRAERFIDGYDGEPEYDEGDIYYQLYCDIKRIESFAALKWLEKIDDAASDGNWQAAAWKLERRYPDEYGKDAGIIKQLIDQQKIIMQLFTGDKQDAQALSDQKGLIENENKNHEG